MYELYHQSFWLSMNRFITSWIVSTFILGIFESFQNLFDTHHSSYPFAFFSFVFYGMNRFTQLVNRVTQLFLCENLHLPLLSIYSHFLITPKSLNHLQVATILSRTQKLFVHKFFKIKHFFLESLCTLSHIDLLGSL